MPSYHYHYLKSGRTWVCLAGIRIRRLLSAELFVDVTEPSRLVRQSTSLVDRCRDRWIDLARSLTAMPRSSEHLLILSCRPKGGNGGRVFSNGVLAVGRGATKPAARSRCAKSLGNLSTLFSAVLDYAEFEPVVDTSAMALLTTHLGAPEVVEFRRRLEPIHIGNERETGQVIRGFASPDRKRPAARKNPTRLEIAHLFPWIPSDDSWWRLVDVMAKESGATSLVVHARGWNTLPRRCLAQARRHLDDVESAAHGAGGASEPVPSLQIKAAALRNEALVRLAALEGHVIGARVFLASDRKPSEALLSVVESSIDDPSVPGFSPGGNLMFRGGARTIDCGAGEIVLPLDNPDLDIVFSPQETPAFLRTPMPTDNESQGFPLNRARTAPFLGTPGRDCPLGVNIHRGLRRNVAMHGESRPRHCYIIGQTGTGKSTFMLHQVLHDIQCGRGVALLDPHGSLIDDVLRRFPKSRSEDLVLLDLADVEHPVGFNPLFLDEHRSVAYRTRRDLLIDELYGYLDKTYDLKRTGGPIFETHFRSMLGLLLGYETPQAPTIPNLLVFRQLYTNTKLRTHLTKRVSGKDNMLEEFVREGVAVRGEASMTELAPYITSKFSRFIADANLRNVTCQNRTLDVESIVRENKVLLVHLGKGRIGDYAAGLLASQIVSRIQHAVMNRRSKRSIKPFYLFADEFQLVASPRFCELLAEGRKFGLSVTMAHQHVSQIPQDVLRSVIGNVGTTVLFRVGPQDSEFFAPMFSPPFGRRDLMSLPNFRAYVNGSGPLGDGSFNVDITPPGSGADYRQAQLLKKLARKKYGRPRKVVEREIDTTLRAFRSLGES